MSRGSVLAVVVVVIAAVVLPGCGGDDEETTTSTTTAETTTGTTGATGATGDDSETTGAPAEEDFTGCLEDLGYTVADAPGSYDAEYGLQIDSGVAAGGADIYVYESDKDLEENLKDIEGSYKFSKPDTVGTVAFLYSEEQTQVRDDVTECVGA